MLHHENKSSDNALTSSSIYSNKKQKNYNSSFDEIWLFYIKGSSRSNKHYKVFCYYCLTAWKHGRPQVIKAYLANHYADCSEDISNYWHQKLIEEANMIQ
ncbi:19294_t:CDS:1, partial [Cetraspora pellucida]